MVILRVMYSPRALTGPMGLVYYRYIINLLYPNQPVDRFRINSTQFKINSRLI